MEVIAILEVPVVLKVSANLENLESLRVPGIRKVPVKSKEPATSKCARANSPVSGRNRSKAV
jgi:hypothetical protein